MTTQTNRDEEMDALRFVYEREREEHRANVDRLKAMIEARDEQIRKLQQENNCLVDAVKKIFR